MSQNEYYGVRFRQSDNNTFTFNTVRANAQEGICLIETTNHQIYLNNFIDQPTAIMGPSQARLYSPQAMAYTYNGTAQTGYMGNYYSDYNGTASNGTGIGSTPSRRGLATSTHSYSPLRATVFLTAPLLQDRRAVRLPRRLLAKTALEQEFRDLKELTP